MLTVMVCTACGFAFDSDPELKFKLGYVRPVSTWYTENKTIALQPCLSLTSTLECVLSFARLAIVKTSLRETPDSVMYSSYRTSCCSYL